MDGSVTGELGKYGVKLPTANSGLSVNFGTEYRSESFDFNPDYIYSNGLQAGGAPSEAINGGFHVWEGFTEMRLPLLSDMTGRPGPVPGGAATATRVTRWASTPTPTSSVWSGRPIHDIRLRGSYNRAVRAPRPERALHAGDRRCGRYGRPVLGRYPDVHSGGVRQDRRERRHSTAISRSIRPRRSTRRPAATPICSRKRPTPTRPASVFQPTFLPNFVHVCGLLGHRDPGHDLVAALDRRHPGVRYGRWHRRAT